MSVFEFMNAGAMLKRTPRTGWNVDNGDVRRSVPHAESVGSHTFGMHMLLAAFYQDYGHSTEFCWFKVSLMITIHDLIEGDPEVGDVSIYILPPEERKQAKRDKDKREQDALVRRCRQMGNIGQTWLVLASELQEGKTPEARIVKELDKLEVAFQAYFYWKRADTDINPQEFFDNARPALSHPWIVAQFDELLARYKRASTTD